MSATKTGLPEAGRIARELARAPIDGLERVGRGINSLVYKVRCGEQSYALKQYPSRNGDPRDRLGSEVAALRLMAQYSLTCVPKIIAVDKDNGFALLEWIEGSAVTEVRDSDIDQAVAFLTAIHGLRQAPEAADCGCDSESCLSGREIERQIRVRLARLQKLPVEEYDLHAFLDRAFVPTRDRLMNKARSQLKDSQTHFDTELPAEQRSLIPSDFGFHNSLRRGDGTLMFLDFEYFGWDDPAKLVSDTLLHPGAPLPQFAAKKLRVSAEQIYSDIAGFRTRLDALYPLFGLRWCLIVLNDFIPERWQKRSRNVSGDSWSDVKAGQLLKARKILEGVSESNGGVVDGV